ncbi:AAA family ATPase [Corynebacterium mayonis]|uniref:AAA family ATPase n=1 Tax=Corynebacterium mayonis TaxID=3062461 RepID=UPI0031407953
MHTPGFYALVGPNAAGKTHYLKTLFGPGAAFVPASADAQFLGYTVRDHIAWAGEAKPLNQIELDFPDTSPIHELSVGQRRSLTIAVALAADEPLLLLDEPFDGLDINTRTRLRDLLIDHIAANPNRTIIMASHRAEDLAGLAEYAIRVNEHEVTEPIKLDDARSSFPIISGEQGDVDKLIRGREVISTSTLGSRMRAHMAEPLDTPDTVTVTYPDDTHLINLIASRKV